MGSVITVTGTALASVVSKHTPMQVRVKPMSGPKTWMPMMNTKEIDPGILVSADSYEGYMGEGGYKKISAGQGFPIRLAAVGIVLSLGTVVAGDSPAQTVGDLKGMRVCGSYPGVPTARIAQEAALAKANLTWNDVKMVPVPNPIVAI